MVLGVTIGVGIIVFLLLYFSTIIDKEKHKHIRTFFLLIALPLLFLIPASLVLEKEVCEVVLNDSEIFYQYGDNFSNNPHWDSYSPGDDPNFNPSDKAAFLFHEYASYNYVEYCYVKEDGSRTFIRAFGIILVIFMIYIAIAFFSDIIAWLRELIKKV